MYKEFRILFAWFTVSVRSLKMLTLCQNLFFFIHVKCLCQNFNKFVFLLMRLTLDSHDVYDCRDRFNVLLILKFTFSGLLFAISVFISDYFVIFKFRAVCELYPCILPCSYYQIWEFFLLLFSNFNAYLA